MRLAVLLGITLCCCYANVTIAQDKGLQLKAKRSPALLRKLPDNQSDTYWIVTNDPPGFRSWLASKRMDHLIVGEYQPSRLFILKTSGKFIDSVVLPSPLVQFADQPRIPKEELVLNGFDPGVNHLNIVHRQYPLVNGQGLTVNIRENRPDTSDIDFKGRYQHTTLTSNTYAQHASIMSTIIAGGGNSFHLGKGVAWGARLTSFDFTSLLPESPASYLQYDVSVQNHSYGTGIENYYGADAAAYDASVVTQPTLLHVFSSGNSGNQTSTSGPYNGIPGYANLTGSFKMAKNILTVGALNGRYEIEGRSSRGPAFDGRIKPELVAFGQEGSSGAAAIVSGIGILVQQTYKEQHAGQLPLSSLTRAVLINSADDIGAPGPDYISGFGNANAWKAVKTIHELRYETNTITQGSIQDIPITITNGIHQLKITVCWTDPAANPNTQKALINDLDLILMNEDGSQSWQPWVLNPAASLTALQEPAVRKRDTLNSIEQISLQNPVPGNYTIRVRGSTVTGPGQFYGLSYQLDTANRFQWYDPANNDLITGGELNTLRWSSTFPAPTGKLEYTVNNGNTWTELSASVNLNQGYYEWNAPALFTTARLRMTINGQPFDSELFTISSRLPLQTGFDCPNSFMLFWKKASGIQQYELYQLGAYYLEPVTTTSDTSITLKKNTSQSMHYAVAPVLSPFRPVMKTYTIQYANQGVECYFKTFLADLQPPNTAIVQIELGTITGVKKLIVEKWNGHEYALLHSIDVNGLTYEVTDNSLHKGANTYRLSIVLSNDLIIHSDPQTVYYFQDNQYLVFPNPVRSGGQLNILMVEPASHTLMIYNSTGQKVLQRQLSHFSEQVPHINLQRGIYFMVLLKDGKRVYKSGIVVR